MGGYLRLFGVAFFFSLTPLAKAQEMPAANSSKAQAPKQVEITADQSLEWYQDQQIYVARGNAKAIRGDMVVDADMLTAHERDKPKTVKVENLHQRSPKPNKMKMAPAILIP